MRSFNEIDFSQASQIYAVANTPLFLIRKLQEDPITHEISRSFTGEEILGELGKSAESEPRELADYVRPYVYLAALSRQPQDVFLKTAGQIANSARWDWFEYVRQVLLDTYRPTTSLEVNAGRPMFYSEPTRTNVPVARNIVTIG